MEVIVATPEQLRQIISEEIQKISEFLPQSAPTQKEYLKTEEVEELFGISKFVLEQDRVKKQGIPYIKKGRLVLYKLEDVREYLEKMKIKVH